MQKQHWAVNRSYAFMAKSAQGGPSLHLWWQLCGTEHGSDSRARCADLHAATVLKMPAQAFHPYASIVLLLRLILGDILECKREGLRSVLAVAVPQEARVQAVCERQPR